MTPKFEPAPAEKGRKTLEDPARKLAYRRPGLRVLGALHQMTRSTGSLMGDAMTMMQISDRAAKQNLVRIGEHPLGIGLYLFDYKPELRAQAGHGRQFGVMADEVEAVLPEAVSVRPDGYKQVDHAMLGVSTTSNRKVP
jgi:hypothetical protein